MPHDLLSFQRGFAAALDEPAAGPLAVYRNTVVHAAVEALRANFPVVEQIVGSEMFAQVAVDYASDCPPGTPILAQYGESFGGWLRAQAWTEDLPYLADVAHLERLHIECLMAADAPVIAASAGERTRDVAPSNFALHPAVRFAWLPTPAMSIWLAHQQGFDGELTPAWKAEGALFARPKPFLVHALCISAAAHRLLSGIRLEEGVTASIDAASGLYPDEDCEAVLSSLLNLGVFAATINERLDP